MIFNYSAGKPEAQSHAAWLRGEERLEDPIKAVGIDPEPRILKRNHELRLLQSGYHARPIADRAHRVYGIHDQVIAVAEQLPLGAAIRALCGDYTVSDDCSDRRAAFASKLCGRRRDLATACAAGRARMASELLQ